MPKPTATRVEYDLPGLSGGSTKFIIENGSFFMTYQSRDQRDTMVRIPLCADQLRLLGDITAEIV